MNNIQTQWLTIRNFQNEDWRALQQIVLSFQSSAYAAYDHPWPSSDGEMKGICSWFSRGNAYLAVCLGNTSGPVGYIALNPAEDEGVFDLGYCFHAAVQGRGLASEACRAVIRYAFMEKNAVKITSGTAAANEPSCRLLSRLGFHKTGEGPVTFYKTDDGEPIYFTGYSFRLTKEEWEATAKE